MEARPMVCYSTGAINSLVDKLRRLLRVKNHPVGNELLQDLESLRKDAVDQFARGRATDGQIKVWMKQVREMIYDIEDWLDPLIAGDDLTDPEQLTNLGESETDKKQLEEFKAQIQEARDRCTRYGLLNKVRISDANLADAAPSEAAATPDSGFLWNEKTILVGLDGPKTKLEEHIKDESKKLKVVSVYGMEGVGKTTLAMEIYGKLKRQFEVRSFICLGQSPTMKTTLLKLLHQVQGTRCTCHPPSFWIDGDGDGEICHIARYIPADSSEQELITFIFELLSAKRYFICIDDIRSTWAWKVIYAALPNNSLGSRILTTTRTKDVAQFCSRRPSDVVYQMKPLSDDDSRRLLLVTASVRKELRSIDFDRVYSRPSKMCGGMPLAIIVTSGLLAWKSAEKVLGGTYMLQILDQCSTSEVTKKILDICFADLTLPVRSCFLYLSAFPANYTIMKDCLIWRWAAEGLLPRREKGEDYFKELIIRRLILPVFDDDDDQAVGCRVHGVIHEFITSLSSEENFVTAGAMLRSESFPCDTIRRFSFDCNNQDASDILKSCTEQLRQIRSLTISMVIERIPDLFAFQLLRLLDIELHIELHTSMSCDQLQSIGRLSLLAYLGLRGYGKIEVPEEIGQLKHLSTLNATGKWRVVYSALPKNNLGSRILTTTTRTKDVAPFTVMKLVSLLAGYVKLTSGMEGGMQELEELSTIRLDSGSSLDGVSELVSKSKKLRMLGLRFHASGRNINRGGVIHLLYELEASSLQSLFLDFGPCITLLDFLLEYWNPKRLGHLRKFVLKATCRSLPQEMASLVQLTHLHITTGIEMEGLRVLGNLPNLVLLHITRSGFDRRCTISKGAFWCLKVFWFECSVLDGVWLQLKEGAMPQLRKVRIKLKACGMRSGDLDFGFQHLCCLEQVHVIINCTRATPPEVEAVEAAITELISGIPRDILLEFSREFEDSMITEKKPSVSLRLDS